MKKAVNMFGYALLFFCVVALILMIFFLPSGTEEAETTTTNTTENLFTVDENKQIVLMMMNEDIAKELSNYPSTVEFETMNWTFERDKDIYTTGSTFECMNAYGVTEKHILIVVSEAYNEGKSVKPIHVYLDGNEVPTKQNNK